jgi:hypothetical protein
MSVSLAAWGFNAVAHIMAGYSYVSVRGIVGRVLRLTRHARAH